MRVVCYFSQKRHQTVSTLLSLTMRKFRSTRGRGKVRLRMRKAKPEIYACDFYFLYIFLYVNHKCSIIHLCCKPYIMYNVLLFFILHYLR